MKKIFKYSIIVLAALVAMPTAMNAQQYNPDPSLKPGEMPEGVVFNKNTTKLSANDYRIDIETYVTGTTTISKVHDPVDFIFVLDRSSSMKGEKNTSMLTGVQSALNMIANDDKIAKDAQGRPQYNRICLVNFSTYPVGQQSKQTDYTKVVQSFTNISNTAATGTITANTAYNKIGEGTHSGTHAERGMELAYEAAVGERQAYPNRPLVVILFTDGAPGYPASWSGTDEYNSPNTANAVIKHKNNIIKLGNAKVYTIGIFGSVSDSDKTNIDHYMNAASSNYPDAESPIFEYKTRAWSRNTGNLGTAAQELKYYKDVKNVSELESIFTDITKGEMNGGSSSDLSGTSTANVDIMSSSFKLPDGMKNSDVKLYVAHPIRVSGTAANPVYEFGDREEFPCNVNVLDKTTKTIITKQIPRPTVNIDTSKQEVVITDFDYSDCYVSSFNNDGTAFFTGCKLIISFHININPENPGGANEPTNDVASGLYIKDEKTGEWNQIAAFQQPTVNNPNLVIVKKGLHVNESAVFTVHDENGKMADMTVVATCTKDGTDAITLIKVQDDGRYTVTENAWSWAYQKPSLSVTKEKAGSDVLNEEDSSITRDVNASTEDSSTINGKKGTFFIFTNSLKNNNPAHGEGFKNNQFSGHTEPETTK